MKTAEKFLEEKGLKDSLYDVHSEIPNQWIKGGLSKLLDDYASSRSMESQWISVEERLPKSNQIDNEYLVVHSKNGTVTTMNFVQGKWHSDIIGGFVEQSLISYWMPLPQPPTN